jgi:uncharacterized protein
MVDLQGADVVAILTRAPSAGGKTRLFNELRSAPDPELLAALLLDTVDAVAVPGTHRVVCFTPPEAEPEMHRLVPAGVLLTTQPAGELGDRMQFVFDDLLARGAAAVVLIGSDLPGIEPSAVPAALQILRQRPNAVVLGPALDGGYYLIGATRTPAALFANIRWGTVDVLAQTEERALAAGVEVARVATAADIDTVEDLRALIRSAAPAARTRFTLHKRGGFCC